MFKRTAPFVACTEVAGIILEVNATRETNPHGFKVGDKVFGTSVSGSLATEAICQLDALYQCPESVDPTLVAGFETNYGTTYHALVDIAQVKEEKKETLLVLGASGGVGMSAIDLGKALGCRVVACASTQKKLQFCADAGADVLINYNKRTNGGKDLKTLLKEAGVYGKIDVVYDPVGGEFSEHALRALAFGGRFLVIGFAAGGATPTSAIPKIPLNLALLNERQIQGCLFGAWRMRDGNRQNRKNMATMMLLIEQKKLTPLVSKVYDFSTYVQAFDELMNRKVVGKIVVAPKGASRTSSNL